MPISRGRTKSLFLSSRRRVGMGATFFRGWGARTSTLCCGSDAQPGWSATNAGNYAPIWRGDSQGVGGVALIDAEHVRLKSSRLLAGRERLPTTPVASLLVAYRHGLRASEVCDLQWQQIELS